MSWPVVALVAGVKIGSGSLSDSLQSRRQLDAANCAARLVFFPAGAGEIAAGDAFDGEHLGAHHHHRAAAQFVGMLANGLRVAAYVGRDQMIGNDILQEVEPEQRHLREHSALVRNAGGQHIVERGDAVGRHEQQVLAVQIVDVANLAAGEKVEVFVVGFKQNGIENFWAHVRFQPGENCRVF